MWNVIDKCLPLKDIEFVCIGAWAAMGCHTNTWRDRQGGSSRTMWSKTEIVFFFSLKKALKYLRSQWLRFWQSYYFFFQRTNSSIVYESRQGEEKGTGLAIGHGGKEGEWKGGGRGAEGQNRNRGRGKGESTSVNFQDEWRTWCYAY